MNLRPQDSGGFGMDFLSDATPSPPDRALAELLLAARRQAWVMAAGVVFGIAAALFHYATSPKMFEASATLLIEEQRTELEQELSAALPTARNDTSMLNEMQILASLQVASDVVATLGLTENADFLNPRTSVLARTVGGTKAFLRGLIPVPETDATDGSAGGGGATDRAAMQAAERLRTATGFHRVGRSFVVDIRFTSHDPALAAAIVNAYAEAYIADGIRATVRSAEERAVWMEARLEDLRTEAQAAAEEAERFRLETGVADQQRLRDLEQRAEALNDLVLRFQNRYRELALESSFPVSSGRILSRALPPRDPAAPRATHTLAAGVFLGLLMGLAAAVLREARETGFRTGADVTRDLGLPFLGYVPPSARWGSGDGRLSRILGWPGARSGHGEARTTARARKRPEKGLPSRHLAEPNGDLPPRARAPAAREAMPHGPQFEKSVRAVFSGLQSRRAQRDSRVIAVASLQQGEDSTAIAIELARQTIRSGRRCLLIDGDFGAAELSRRLGLAGAEGALDVLEGACGLEAALDGEMTEDLDILPAGRCADPDHAMAYLAEFGDLIGDLADGYDDIVVHLPPLLDTPEATGLLARADHTVLAVAWGRTPRQLVQGVVAETPGLRGPGAGVVLSRVALNRLSRYGVIRPRRNGWNSGRGTAKST
jgi:uncharacterized protein involved in exopolysaccharide biosynthesis/Mrp family chromosome partitioning ATPase